MNKYFVTTLMALTALSATAAPKARKEAPAPAPEVSTRQEALKENSSIDEKAYKKTIQASEAQQADVQSFLKLQDPTPELRNRPWLWSFAFKLQSFQPQGTGRAANTNFALENYGTTVMPSIEFGFLLNPVENKKWNWGSGAAVHVGYTAQQTSLVTPSGYAFDDARLNSGLLSLVWNNRIHTTTLPNWTALINPEYGVVNYTQTSAKNSQANFNQQNNYWGTAIGVEYAMSKKWGVLGQYSYREASAGKSEVTDLQNSNFEIGTSVVW
jgi:hypothetical protein